MSAISPPRARDASGALWVSAARRAVAGIHADGRARELVAHGAAETTSGDHRSSLAGVLIPEHAGIASAVVEQPFRALLVDVPDEPVVDAVADELPEPRREPAR